MHAGTAGGPPQAGGVGHAEVLPVRRGGLSQEEEEGGRVVQVMCRHSGAWFTRKKLIEKIIEKLIEKFIEICYTGKMKKLE